MVVGCDWPHSCRKRRSGGPNGQKNDNRCHIHQTHWRASPREVLVVQGGSNQSQRRARDESQAREEKRETQGHDNSIPVIPGEVTPDTCPGNETRDPGGFPCDSGSRIFARARKSGPDLRILKCRSRVNPRSVRSLVRDTRHCIAVPLARAMVATRRRW